MFVIGDFEFGSVNDRVVGSKEGKADGQEKGEADRGS